jgi:hypothetical protein
LLGELVASLSTFLGVQFEPTSWFIHDDQPGHASACNCVDVRGIVSPAFQLYACGVICISINFGEAAWVNCDLLLFAGGSRVRGLQGHDLLVLPYSETGWSEAQWVSDETGEWQSHVNEARWDGAYQIARALGAGLRL